MSSLPTVDQWSLVTNSLRDTGLSVVVVSEIIRALLQVMEKSGYGTVSISVAGGQVQEFKVIQSRRLSEDLVHDHEESVSVELG